MYDLRVLVIWLVLGFLLYLITIKPERAASEKKRDENQYESDDIAGLDWKGPVKQSDREVINKLRSMRFINHIDMTVFKSADCPMGLIPGELILELEVIPLRVENKTLILAMIDPFDLNAIDMVREITGHEVKPVIIAQKEFRQIIGEESVVG